MYQLIVQVHVQHFQGKLIIHISGFSVMKWLNGGPIWYNFSDMIIPQKYHVGSLKQKDVFRKSFLPQAQGEWEYGHSVIFLKWRQIWYILTPERPSIEILIKKHFFVTYL